MRGFRWVGRDETDNDQYEATPEFFDWLEEQGADKFQLAAFNFVDFAGQFYAAVLIDTGNTVGEALEIVSNVQRRLGR